MTWPQFEELEKVDQLEILNALDSKSFSMTIYNQFTDDSLPCINLIFITVGETYDLGIYWINEKLAKAFQSPLTEESWILIREYFHNKFEGEHSPFKK